MRSQLARTARWLVVVLTSLAAVQGIFAHPGSGIVVDDKGQIYFCHTGVCIWKIDTNGTLVQLEGPANHWLAVDADGSFVDQRWPRVLEYRRPGVFHYVDAGIVPIGKSPTLLSAGGFPIAVGPNGDLYYPEPTKEERLQIKRLTPGGKPVDFATLPLAMEIAPNYKQWKAMWIHGLVAANDGTLYYAEKEAVRRIDADGTVSPIAENIEVPGCEHGDDHRGGPILRGLDISPDGTIYAAAMACQSVIRITQRGEISVALRSEESWTPTGIAVKGNDVYVLEFWFAEHDNPESWLPRVRKLMPNGSLAVLATLHRCRNSGGTIPTNDRQFAIAELEAQCGMERTPIQQKERNRPSPLRRETTRRGTPPLGGGGEDAGRSGWRRTSEEQLSHADDRSQSSSGDHPSSLRSLERVLRHRGWTVRAQAQNDRPGEGSDQAT